MNDSIFSLFKIGIGPSSSHTVGPLKSARSFLLSLKDKLYDIKHIKVELLGSLGATGIGHGSDKAILLGLLGENEKTVDVEKIDEYLNDIKEKSKINLLRKKEIPFDYKKDLILNGREFLSYHPNAVRFNITFENNEKLIKIYYSIGGGFIESEEEIGKKKENIKTVPFVFNSGEELLKLCKENKLSISALMMQNELTFRNKEEIENEIMQMWQVMSECIEQGKIKKGYIPSKLKVKRRAFNLFESLNKKQGKVKFDPLDTMDWINFYAFAVSEQNASGARVVTAPTNGAAGIIPAVISYMKHFIDGGVDNKENIVKFFLTAGAIGLLYQKNASISGADVGCQGEVGVACSMAAGALAECTGANIYQVEYASEIGMEHNLGLTCDPVGGLVQVPCIERNAMGATKAINACRMALNSDGKSNIVSLDKVMKTMMDTGKDMMSKYKETSQGGLAVNIAEC